MRGPMLLLLALVAAPLAAQPSVHPADRRLGRIGLGIGPPGASGLSVWSPSLSYGAPCYAGGARDPYYECGSAAVAYVVDGEVEYDVLTSHTLYVAPWSSVDPYVVGFAGVGYGEGLGLVWGAEVGLNLWITASGGVTVYGGYVRGERQRYVRPGVWLVVDAGY